MSSLALFVLGGLVVFGVVVYLVWRYNDKSKAVADALVADEQKAANTVTGWLNHSNTDPVVVTPVVVANTVVANTSH